MEHRLFDKPFDVKKKTKAVVVAKEDNETAPDFNSLAFDAFAIFLTVVGVVMLMKVLSGVFPGAKKKTNRRLSPGIRPHLEIGQKVAPDSDILDEERVHF